MKPGKALLRALYGFLGLAVVAALARGLSWPWQAHLETLWPAATLLLAAVALVDAISTLREDAPEVARKLPRSLALGRRSPVGLYLRNRLRRGVTGAISDHYPASLEVTDMPRKFSLPPGAELRFDYHVEPGRRGSVEFSAIELLLDSPWGLWVRRVRVPCTAERRVYPDFLAQGSLREISAGERAASLGIHLHRRRGEGTDFLQLREFREGDPLRQVDWKASARLCKLVSREYQDEQDRDIIFLLDCGRRMRGRDGHLSHFDHALNALLLTAWFAARQGDALGVCAFAGSELWVAPRKHREGIGELLDKLYDLHATTRGSDFIEAALRLTAKRNKRALVILLTNLQAEDDADLQRALGILGKKHAVILANFQEIELAARIAAPVHSLEDALTHCAAAGIVRERQRVVTRVRDRGAWVVDCLPHQLGSALAAQYLALKRAGVT